MRYIYFYETILGRIGIAENGKGITNIFFKDPDESYIVDETGLIRAAITQLQEYFQKKRTMFDLPLSYNGTAFQKKVWDALKTIPYGETRSYKQIALQIGNPKASRAVGMANNKNPIPIIIPCHRVIGLNGRLIGYANGIGMKKKILDIEA